MQRVSKSIILLFWTKNINKLETAIYTYKTKNTKKQKRRTIFFLKNEVSLTIYTFITLRGVK